MLVVSTSENGIKILANGDGVRLLHSIENQAVVTPRVAPTTIAKGPIISNLIWCFPFNCWNKHLILVEVHRNTKAFDF
ncbi:hypothetical protein ACB098_05G070400 [Castanea mollissima]|uniref:Uncharacterized protein n=1 Tax=Castanea mollissima TaxID=60419 RepID=A0A8J4RLI1_9ROSI|nr:hypothetical protein CMV_011325 [Castanea mollissima]